ncbi:MAG: hypothetical protein LLF78_00900 [Synergistaceae bacterium]|nr:hypothetical protein [Synergistaceae bacterium]
MRVCIRKIAVFGIAVLILILGSSASFALDSSAEVRRLNREAPSLDGFAGMDALVWLRDNTYRMLADGTMENTRNTIVMMGERIPDPWKEIKIPVPSDGTLTIDEAAWYNPMTGLKEGTLRIEEERLNGGALVKVIKTPDEAVGRAVVLVERETRSKRYGVDETIAMAGPLPIWEQNLLVELPEGRELYWIARDVKDPVIGKSGGVQSYKWTIMNQEPWHGEGFVVYKRPSLSFSSRKGITQSLSAMDEVAKMIPSIPLPNFAVKGDKAKTGIKLMEWISAPSRTLAGYPRGWVRSTEQIPAGGPWTPWEQTLILNKWLKKLGWQSYVWWQAAEELDKDSPATSSIWISPVLELAATGGKSYFYQAGQTSDFGMTSPAIAGSHLYRLKNGEYEHRSVDSGSASDHRLAFLWILDLNDAGGADGTLSINVSGGWTELMSGGHIPSQEGLGGFLRGKVDFAIPGMELTPTSVTPTSTGYKLDFRVKCVPGIVHNGNLLLRLPGGIPVRVGEMIGRNSDYILRFPFTVDQKVRMKMPRGYKLIQVPPVKKLGEGSKAILKESIIYWPKKAQLLADSTWTVKLTKVDSGLAALLKEELDACLRWPVLDLPFRK